MKLFILISILMALQTQAQTTLPKIKDWHYLDYNKDGYRGISLAQAYDLLKGKKSTKVIVAVIDSGIDTLHNDIPYWHNPNEIPNNKIDDDKNGLVDDVIGWNYLGSPTGENLSISVTDIYRTYHRFKQQFENTKETDVAVADKYVYSEWKRAKEKLFTSYNEAIKNIETITNNLDFLQKSNGIVTQLLGKETFTRKDLALQKATKQQQAQLNVWKNVFGENDFTNTDFLKDYEGYKKELEEAIRQIKETPIDYRGNLLQDNSYDITKKSYGNTNLQTHSGYHGTSVSSIIGAVRGNNKGIDGIANNVDIMMLRAILGKDEYDKDVAIAIRYAVDNGAKVINMSFGKYISPDKKWVDEAMQYALSKDVILVHGSGNDGTNIDEDYNYPNAYLINGAKLPNFINVGASGDNSTGSLAAPFSNYGKKMVDVFAPGVDIHCAIVGGGTQVASGTSMASPVVAGIAALLKSYFPKLTAPQIVGIIKQSAVPITDKVVKPNSEKEQVQFNTLCETGGIVNAAEAVKLAMLLK